MRLRTIATATLILGATASLAIACSVPVFRYALEHWRPDPYIVFVFHKEELTVDQQSIIDSMQPTGEHGNPVANVRVKVVDVDLDSDPVTQAIRRDHQSEKLPWMVVLSPPKWGPAQTTWQGEFTRDNVGMVMDSPTRTDISTKLIDGDSVVWILLECGRKEEDDRAYDVLTTELRKLESTIKLPEIDVADLGDLSVAPEALKVAFSSLRISRDDKKERALVEMLLRVESDLLEEPQVSQPMAFPVFGRGRVLYTLVGNGIAPDVIKDACEFLTEGCQCTVKAQNPGVDLIMNVDWEGLVIPTESLDKDLPTLAGFSGFGRPDDGLDSKDAEGDASVVERKQGGFMAEPTKASVSSDTVSPELAMMHVDESSSASHAEVATSGVDGSEDHHAEASDIPSAGIGKNVLLVLLFLLIGAVVATWYFMPRAN